MPRLILGLDIGGANLKAATSDKRAASVPFALWKEPDRLPAVLAELVGRFPEAEELAVTMTGELCDCFRTKREGVNHILNAVLNVSRSRPVWVWTTDGEFVNFEEARRQCLKVASANWHALATFAGGYVPSGLAVLIDIGSTTTDLIPIFNGEPVPEGKTDTERMAAEELVYTGVRRTPVCAILPGAAAEFFATSRDVYLVLGLIREEPSDTDTADARPATRENALGRLARMIGGDIETLTEEQIVRLAEDVLERQLTRIDYAAYIQLHRLDERRRAKHKSPTTVRVLLSGSGEFLGRLLSQRPRLQSADFDSIGDRLGPELSACAPAYAVAILAAERRP